MGNHYFLFDIDGVLLKPGGYRKASNETLVYFLTQIGFKDLPDFDPVFVLFESMGITSEWDMLPLLLVAALEKTFQNYQLSDQLTNWEDITRFVENQNGKFFLPEFEIKHYEDFLIDGISPADAVYENRSSNQFLQIFPVTSTYCPWVYEKLLSATRNPNQSEITSVFQNLILGDKLFEKILQNKASIKTDSYLVLYDQNNLGSLETQIILQKRRENKIYCAAMTARPSGYPDGKNNHKLYFPEAELGLKTVSLEEIPVIGYGSMSYLAECFGETGDYYIKPSPIHALSAVLASHGKTIMEFVTLAYSILMDNMLTSEKRNLLNELFPQGSTIHVFEDSAIGLRSVKKMVDWLVLAGYQVEGHLYGVSTDREKINALKKESAVIYESINTALQKGMGWMRT